SELIAELVGAVLPEEARGYLKRIQSSAERLDSMIQDVLKYTKVSKSPIHCQPVNTEQLIRDVISEYPHLQPTQADILIEGPLLPVKGHEGFLTQCLSNLLSNAVKFVPPKTRPQVKIYTREAGQDIQLFVEDNGIGIEPKDQRRIFRIFQRLHPAAEYEGTG